MEISVTEKLQSLPLKKPKPFPTPPSPLPPPPPPGSSQHSPTPDTAALPCLALCPGLTPALPLCKELCHIASPLLLNSLSDLPLPSRKDASPVLGSLQPQLPHPLQQSPQGPPSLSLQTYAPGLCLSPRRFFSALPFILGVGANVPSAGKCPLPPHTSTGLGTPSAPALPHHSFCHRDFVLTCLLVCLPS